MHSLFSLLSTGSTATMIYTLQVTIFAIDNQHVVCFKEYANPGSVQFQRLALRFEEQVQNIPGGVLRLKEVLGTCRGIGSHFHPSGK